MTMYCPRCSSLAVEGQRFCRACGMNLGVIIDAIEGKQRGPIDFETLKRDLRELGANLRTGFEEAGVVLKKTHRLDKETAKSNRSGAPFQMPNWSREFDKALRKVKAAHSRKYSLQQATLSIFSGSALMVVWYYILNGVIGSGLLGNIETIVLENSGQAIDLQGLEKVIRLLWLFGFIPIARGVAHLINGVFFAPKQQIETEDQYAPSPVLTYPSAVSAIPEGPHTTNELGGKVGDASQPSVTEDATLRFEPK